MATSGKFYPTKAAGFFFDFWDALHGNDIGIEIDANGTAHRVEWIDGAGVIERTKIENLGAFLVEWFETYDKAN